MKTIHTKATLVGSMEEFGGYITYVFENFNYENNFDRYIMCVRCPHWNSSHINIGDTGFLQCKEVTAGDDCWYDPSSGTKIPYRYTNMYFEKFIPDTKREDIIL